MTKPKTDTTQFLSDLRRAISGSTRNIAKAHESLRLAGMGDTLPTRTPRQWAAEACRYAELLDADGGTSEQRREMAIQAAMALYFAQRSETF